MNCHELPYLMLQVCTGHLFLSRLLWSCFPPPRLLCCPPAVVHCCIFWADHPSRTTPQSSPSFSTIPHDWLLDRLIVSLASTPSSTVTLPVQSIIRPHSSRKGREQRHSLPLITWHCVLLFSYSSRLIVGSFGRLAPPPSATFRPAGESIRAPCNPRCCRQRKHGGALALALSASNDEESVFRLWASVVEGTGLTRLLLTHVDTGDDRSGILRDVGGRFGRSEAQRRVISSWCPSSRICAVGSTSNHKSGPSN